MKGQFTKNMQEKEKDLIVNHLVEKGYEKELVEQYIEPLEKYINGLAKEFLNGHNGMIEDSTVFNWCEDYFHDEEYKKATPTEKKPVKKEEKTEILDGDGNYTPEKKDLEPIFKRPKASKSKEAEGQVSLW